MCYNFVSMATQLTYMGVRGLLHILYIVSVDGDPLDMVRYYEL